MKKIEEMTDHEILMELIREKRRQDRLRIVRIIFRVALLLLLLWLGFTIIPKIIEVYNKWNMMLEQIQAAGNKVTGMVEELDFEPNFEIMESIQTGIDAITDFLRKLGL